MGFIPTIDSKLFLQPGEENGVSEALVTVSLTFIFSFVWLPPRVSFPVLSATLAHSVSQLGSRPLANDPTSVSLG